MLFTLQNQIDINKFTRITQEKSEVLFNVEFEAFHDLTSTLALKRLQSDQKSEVSYQLQMNEINTIGREMLS